MRKYLLTLTAMGFLLAGCQKHLSTYLASAHKTFADKNYVDTIDALNTGLSYWQESDGPDQKAEAYELLGKSYHALRNLDKALDTFQEAAKISQNRFDVYYDMASIYLTKEIADQAERNFREALRIKPDDPLALLGLGNSLYEQRKTDEARAAFQRILETSPGVKDALESLAALKRPPHHIAAKAAPVKKTALKKNKRKKTQADKRT